MQELAEGLRGRRVCRQRLEAVDCDHARPALCDQRANVGENIVEAAVVERLSQVLEEHARPNRRSIEEVKALAVAQNLLERF